MMTGWKARLIGGLAIIALCGCETQAEPQIRTDDMTASFIGLWELLPELSIYQTGTPPVAGTYAISQSEGRITFDIEWQPAGGEVQTMSFGAPADGATEDLGGGNSMTLDVVDKNTLDSTAFAQDQKIAYARRSVSADGQLLAVMQEAIKAPDKTTRNFQVYRRADTSVPVQD